MPNNYVKTLFGKFLLTDRQTLVNKQTEYQTDRA